MSCRFRQHIVSELFDKSIRGFYPGQVKQAQKSLFAWSFKCSRKDECDSIALGHPENSVLQEADPPIYACKFGEGQNFGHILVLANEDGQIGLRDTRQLGSSTPVKDVIATGARDGSVIIWDRRCKPHHKADEIAPAHQSLTNKSITSPSIRKAGTGGSVANNSVTGVLFQQQHILISAGASDGLIKLWDLRKTHGGGKRDPQCQSLLEHSGRSSHRGFTSLSISPSRDVLYISCMDNVIYAYHLANPTPHPVAEYTGHVNLTYFVKSCVSPCGSYILSGSSDNYAYIWLTDHPGKPVARLTGHFAEVTSVGWCPIDDEKLVTCADDMKLRIFRRKNANMDDFDEKANICGMSEPYIGEHDGDSTITNRSEVETKERRVCDSQEPLPPLPVTPSTLRNRGSLIATPSNTREREGQCSSHASQTLPQTPQQQTPRHKHGVRGRVTPCTPKTSERNTLLHWLASAKTPGTQRSPSTPGSTVVSDSKKASLKRKLTDLIDEDQENVRNEAKPKSPISPQKNILCTSAATNIPEISHPSAAKMLKYGDEAGPSNPRKCQNIGEESITDMNDSVKPIEIKDKEAIGSGFRKPVTNVSSKCFEKNAYSPNNENKDDIILQALETHVSVQNASSPAQFRFGHLTSPTANLPNYVVDGLSPHSRPENKVEKKRPLDWLTSFSHQRKLKFTRVPEKNIKNLSQFGASGTHKHRERKVLHIKHKKKKCHAPQ
ncbi:uncharacterized protein l(2)dtl isoform X2 [Panulirus ornatus]|uniref:uncharacterized protein l(2)dtl isoform X2 n=1 Tax=Panulirus ornatus TaxID=150431 RepID=UPI003A89B2F8